jgi:hypothetical protein
MEKLEFAKKRNLKIVTPCCKKNNKDGKFASYKGFEEQAFGYCHSCGKTTLPMKLDAISKNQNHFKPIASNVISTQKLSFIPESIIWKSYINKPINNLSKYLLANYPSKKVQSTLVDYVLGSNPNCGTVFWYINKQLRVQKSKICFYNTSGKRTNKFYVPYKNDKGYRFCLYGEHLLLDHSYNQIVLLVESEKTAIVGSIVIPEYTWLAYSGINGLTDEKIKTLKGYKVVIIPDLSDNAVQIIQRKLPLLRQTCGFINILDLRNGKTDVELKAEGVYNNDLEDFIRAIKIHN